MKKCILLMVNISLAVFFYGETWAAPSRTGLVAEYLFAGNAKDSSSKGRNGTVQGGATLTADRWNRANNAYGLDGVDDSIDLGNWFNY